MPSVSNIQAIRHWFSLRMCGQHSINFRSCLTPSIIWVMFQCETAPNSYSVMLSCALMVVRRGYLEPKWVKEGVLEHYQVHLSNVERGRQGQGSE